MADFCGVCVEKYFVRWYIIILGSLVFYLPAGFIKCIPTCKLQFLLLSVCLYKFACIWFLGLQGWKIPNTIAIRTVTGCVIYQFMAVFADALILLPSGDKAQMPLNLVLQFCWVALPEPKPDFSAIVFINRRQLLYPFVLFISNPAAAQTL